MERRIKELAEENKQLHAEATELANEAKECEEKEEKLVGDAVKHLTEANVQINSLSRKFTTKTNESYKQKEEITHLLAQVSANFFINTCIIFWWEVCMYVLYIICIKTPVGTTVYFRLIALTYYIQI